MITKKGTKQILAESLEELMLKRSVEKISVKDICSNCRLTTTTFYNHFLDKYDLISWIYTSHTDPIIQKSMLRLAGRML